jgi:hypothetical protein
MVFLASAFESMGEDALDTCVSGFVLAGESIFDDASESATSPSSLAASLASKLTLSTRISLPTNCKEVVRIPNVVMPGRNFCGPPITKMARVQYTRTKANQSSCYIRKYADIAPPTADPDRAVANRFLVCIEGLARSLSMSGESTYSRRAVCNHSK